MSDQAVEVRDEQSLSGELFGLHLSELLPWSLGDGIHVAWASTEDLLSFMGEHYGAIFKVEDGDTRFLREPMSEAKLRFLARSDRLMFVEGRRPIGMLVGNPQDWSTYYWRTVAFLPEFQGRGLLAACLERTDAAMRAVGIQRVEGETAPVNHHQIRALSRLGYCVTGQSNSERFGALLRLTKYLSPAGKRVFVGQFCA